MFLLMGKEYRISRSIRAQWFFQQFNTMLPHPKPHDELVSYGVQNLLFYFLLHLIPISFTSQSKVYMYIISLSLYARCDWLILCAVFQCMGCSFLPTHLINLRDKINIFTNLVFSVL